MSIEIWKDVVGYEGLYQVSSEGRVKSVDRWVKCNTGTMIKKGTFLKFYDREGYDYVFLYKNGQRLFTGVGRLVAIAFIPNPDNLPEVNHKNEIKKDNRVENLEWCTRDYNMHYGTQYFRAAQKRTNGIRSRKILQYTKSGEFIAEYPSMGELKRLFGYNQGAISMCCSGKCKSVYGFVWRYAS